MSDALDLLIATGRERLVPWSTVHEFASVAGMGEALLRREIKRGRIPHVRNGRHIKIATVAALDKLLEEAGRE